MNGFRLYLNLEMLCLFISISMQSVWPQWHFQTHFFVSIPSPLFLLILWSLCPLPLPLASLLLLSHKCQLLKHFSIRRSLTVLLLPNISVSLFLKFYSFIYLCIFICVSRHASGGQRTILRGCFSLATLRGLNLGGQACAQALLSPEPSCWRLLH